MAITDFAEDIEFLQIQVDSQLGKQFLLLQIIFQCGEDIMFPQFCIHSYFLARETVFANLDNFSVWGGGALGSHGLPTNTQSL